MGRRTRASAAAREAPEHRLRARQQALRRAGDGARVGALVGAVFAGLALLVGGGRLVLALLDGRSVALPSTWDDARAIAAYALAFVVGGAAVGAVHAAFGRRPVTAVAFMGAGALVMNVIAMVDGAPGSYDGRTAVWMTGIGCVFGLAAAYGLARKG